MSSETLIRSEISLDNGKQFFCNRLLLAYLLADYNLLGLNSCLAIFVS